MTEKDLDVAIEKCERIMEFDTRTLKNPESENGWIFGKVYDLLKFLRQCQFDTNAKGGGVDDLISRQAAMKLFKDDSAAVNELNNLPSQPDRMKYVQEAVNTIMNTCKSDSIKDKAFRNAARMIQNAIDGEAPDFETIEELPSAQPRWIPCSERLPEEDGQYIVTVKYEHVDGYEDIYSENGEWVDGHWDACMFGYCGRVEKVLAWQPLPEPWEGA